MATLCARCLQPRRPVDECICPDDDMEPGEDSSDEDAA